MSKVFEKMIDKINRIDQLTRLKATGTPEQLAQRLNVSPSTLYEYIVLMKMSLRAPIMYCRVRKSYVYKFTGRLTFEFKQLDRP